MFCLLISTKALPKPILTYRQLSSWEDIWMKCDSKYEILIQQNAVENVRQISIIFNGLNPLTDVLLLSCWELFTAGLSNGLVQN